jgi:hypothetical protein
MASLARTLTAGEANQEGNMYEEAEPDAIKAYVESFSVYINLLFAVYNDKEENSNNSNQTGSTQEKLDQAGDSWKLYATLADITCFNRRIFRTQNGTSGIGPGCLRKGDIIAVLSGASTLFALRPRGEHYLLLGQVYIDDIKIGDLMEEIAAGKIELQKFCFD